MGLLRVDVWNFKRSDRFYQRFKSFGMKGIMVESSQNWVRPPLAELSIALISEAMIVRTESFLGLHYQVILAGTLTG